MRRDQACCFVDRQQCSTRAQWLANERTVPYAFVQPRVSSFNEANARPTPGLISTQGLRKVSLASSADHDYFDFAHELRRLVVGHRRCRCVEIDVAGNEWEVWHFQTRAQCCRRSELKSACRSALQSSHFNMPSLLRRAGRCPRRCVGGAQPRFGSNFQQREVASLSMEGQSRRQADRRAQ